jgi:cyclic lactone autoinducer peptide
MKNTKSKSNVVLKIVERVARMEMNYSSDSWPPKCSAILHQPKRPMKRKNNS